MYDSSSPEFKLVKTFYDIGTQTDPNADVWAEGLPYSKSQNISGDPNFGNTLVQPVNDGNMQVFARSDGTEGVFITKAGMANFKAYLDALPPPPQDASVVKRNNDTATLQQVATAIQNKTATATDINNAILILIQRQ